MKNKGMVYKSRKKAVLKKVKNKKLIPNAATIGSLAVGLSSILFATKGQWDYALLATIGAAFLDATDGRLARHFNVSSRFGAELDSLSDFATFGVSPGVTLYLFGLSSLDNIGWLFSIFFVICMCLRLARFNTHDIENVNLYDGQYLTGVPAPAGALLCLAPIVFYLATGCECFKASYSSIASALIAGSLCVSTLPTLSNKKLPRKKISFKVAAIGIGVIVCLFIAFTWEMLGLVIIAYLASIAFTCKASKQHRV